jgi:hypothetical protein
MTDAGAVPRRRSVLPVKGSEGSQQLWNSQRERHRGEDTNSTQPRRRQARGQTARTTPLLGPADEHEEETRARCPTAGTPVAELQPRPTPQQDLTQMWPETEACGATAALQDDSARLHCPVCQRWPARRGQWS